MNDTELMQSVLEELQTLNQNFSDYRIYIEDRNNSFDEKALQESKQLEEEKALLEEKTTSEQAESDTYMSKLTEINDTLVKVENKTTSFVDKNITVSATAENIEYNGSYLFTINCIMLGVLALFLGAFLARTCFRKL